MMDPAKLKVVELRAELSKRGLDTKGNKPVLVERLRKALEEDTRDDVEEETVEINSGSEKVIDSVRKDASEETPEPVTPSKTTGRSSRSTTSTTPTKTASLKGSPKIVLTPLPEKQVSPAKSPSVEKTETFDETFETSADDRVAEIQKEQTTEAPTVMIEESSKTIAEIEPNITDQSMENTQAESQGQLIQETEETVSSKKDESIVGVSNEQPEEQTSQAEFAVSTDACKTKQDMPEPKDKDAQNDIISETCQVADDDILENDETRADADNQDLPKPMEITEVITTDKSNVKIEENETIEDSSDLGEKPDVKPNIALKEEVDEKPNIADVPRADERSRNVETKDVKIEADNDAERDSKDRDKKDRKDRKRKRSSSPQEEKIKSPPPGRPIDEPNLKEADVVLSWYDSDLNLVINKESFLSATAMHNDGFGYIWAGARASYGFTEGMIYYEAKITEYCEVNLQGEQSPHVLRVGWSVQGTSMQLGEEPLTYGFGGTGKISSNNKFSDYGTSFGKDDVIGCYLNFNNGNNIVISYTINGKDMGPAFTVPKSVLEGKPLYPHILTKNCTFVCNFGQKKPWCAKILDGYVPVGMVDLKNRVHGPRRPETVEECEIIMMCGLPAAGKTVWATKYAENNRDKMYNILGTNSLIEKMKVIGLPRRRNYVGRWEVLIDKCTRCLNKLLEIASTRRRNYILDQTNVYPSAQRRKMRNFYGYQRRAVIIVPTDEEFKSRTAKRTASDGDIVPDSAVLEMKANFGAPVVGDIFDAVEWVELPAEEGKKLIEKYNKEGKEAGYGQQQASKRPRFERTDNHRDSRDSRQNSRDSRDSRDHRDRRNNYPDRNRTSTWRGGNNNNGWRDRQARSLIGHARHSGGGSGGGYGGSLGGSGWRGRGGSIGSPISSYRPSAERRAVSGHDRRTSGSDRNRSASSRQGGSWGLMNSYQNTQQSSGWDGNSQSGNWQGSQSQQQGSWGNQPTSWTQQQQQQWDNWKSYGQGNNYSQGNYSQQGYGNGNWSGWNQQYYNQYWGQQQPTGQTSAAGSQAVSKK